jgi:uncharacterized membrane protein (DUF2068 family)
MTRSSVVASGIWISWRDSIRDCRRTANFPAAIGDHAMTADLHHESGSPGQARKRDRILTLIALFKFGKALLLIALGLGALQLIRSDVREQANSMFEALGSSIDVAPVLKVLRQIGALAPSRLRLIGGGAFLYAALFLTEGIGLWRQRRWAEYLTVIATASFIPFELFELTRRLTYPRASALLINIGVLAYLIWRLQHPTSWQVEQLKLKEAGKEERLRE